MIKRALRTTPGPRTPASKRRLTISNSSRTAARCWAKNGLSSAPLRSEPWVRRSATVFAADELVVCMDEGTAPAGVIHAAGQAGIPNERIMESIWLPV
jgi:hypothetical protein